MKHNKSYKTKKRIRRHARVRSQISGTSDRPRLAVFRSNRYISVQAIDDTIGKTVAAANDMKLKKGTKTERAAHVGTEIAKNLSAKKIKQVVFDRGGYLFAGRVKALAEAARAAGLEF